MTSSWAFYMREYRPLNSNTFNKSLSIIYNTLFIVFMVASAALAQMPVPQLPQVYIDTTFNLPTGTTWNAHTAAAFKTILTSANPGDVIVLDAGVQYTGNFTLPAKTNADHKWIYIVSSALGKFHAPGWRVGPSDAINMPKIVTVNTG